MTDDGYLPLPLDRILDLALQVEDGAPLTHDERAQITRLLFLYMADLQARGASRIRGRRVARSTWALAFAATVLVREHETPIKAALAALLPRGTVADMNRVARAYQKLTHRRGKLPISISVDQKVIDDALVRLAKSRKRNK